MTGKENENHYICRKTKSGEYKSGYSCDDKAGIYFENEKVTQVVALDQKSNTYYVILTGAEVKETIIQKIVLPPAWP